MYTVEIDGITLRIEAPAGLFSPAHADPGTLAMLRISRLEKGDKLLDLGCGAGIVGIYGAKKLGEDSVLLCDCDPAAVEASRKNALLNSCPKLRVLQSDALEAVEERDFSLILSNPPYHADFSVPKRFIEQGFNHLKLGGQLIMVTKRRDWYKNKLISIFGGVSITEEDGYFIFTAVKKGPRFAGAKPRRPKKK